MMTKPQKNVPNFALRNPVGPFLPMRTIRRYEALDKKQEEAILKFYDELAPNARDITVDIEMIVNKGFPVFQEALGNENWKKVQHYFGIGVKAPSKNIRHDEVSFLISKLRTIETAQYYLYGFTELLEKFAVKLSRTPEGMITLEKAKVVRMFMILFSTYFFFAEDFARPLGSEELKLNYLKAAEVNKLQITPEEMFYLYQASVKRYSDGSILYDAIIEWVKSFDKKIRKEFLEVAELKLTDGDILVSVNSKPSNNTFGYVRGIKTKMFPMVGYFPAELYVITDMWKTLEFGELYNIYKKLKQNEFSSFATHTRKNPYVRGIQFMENTYEFRVIGPNVEMSCEEEANRYVRFIEYLARNNFTMPIELTTEEKDEVIVEQVEIGKFFAFLRFARNAEYLTEDSSCNDEYSMYLTLLEQEPNSEIFGEYMRNEISDEEVKSRLGIDRKFEEEVLGIKHLETPLEAVKRFAEEKGMTDISEELAENVLILGNEQLWERYSQGELNADKLMDKLGFDQEIMEMYFYLSKIDIPVIEQKLQELKTRRVSPKEMKKNALTINLYCYIVEGQIACGPKNKAPKGNKRLKPDNLRKLIAA